MFREVLHVTRLWKVKDRCTGNLITGALYATNLGARVSIVKDTAADETRHSLSCDSFFIVPLLVGHCLRLYSSP
jgi:hypothetical protein